MYELKGTEMKTKYIWVGYMIKFLCLTFYRCLIRALWMVWQISYLQSVSGNILLWQLRITVATAAFILPANTNKVVVQGSTHISYFMGSKVRWMRWPNNRSTPATPFPWKHSVYEVCHFLVEFWRRPVLLEQHVIRTLFFQNKREEFLQHVQVHYACHSKFGKD
jgi:hypothetical protein